MIDSITSLEYPVMNLNSLLCSLLAAYACGASGTYEKPRREV
ncbi:hypothetical protein PSH58_02920 [Pseudomonas hefeiensis]|uniref:Lipoprotein n=1 Tax=Pseudomonas hefeiensis TaxID=2738125 RepID=A0ABY9GCQ1_9PSED|nr:MULTISPECIES: hypothetical protein [unclassified Pseudomonas]WLH13331.1 hypothetical protein PSH57_02925 [Pseudomonas sp. FP205]WLH96390.1 hypothetical protein PSH58_02920 [Pseudomonas sp. FP53]WLI40666.1 hypothetical protein PSH74_02925 [Pseudomonas sp. FP821]